MPNAWRHRAYSTGLHGHFTVFTDRCLYFISRIRLCYVMGVNALKILRGSSPFVLPFPSLQSWLCSSYCRGPGPTLSWTPAGQMLGVSCPDPCDPGFELPGGLEVEPPPPVLFMSTDAHFWVKISHKLQSLGKISNILAADPRSSFRSIPTLLWPLQRWRLCAAFAIRVGHSEQRVLKS